MNHTEIDDALRLLDPAGPAGSPADGPHRLGLGLGLGDIVTTEAEAPRVREVESVRVPRRARPARRLALLGGAAAALAAALVLAPDLTGGDAAFATWTAAPDGLSAQQRDAADASCRQSQREGAGRGDAERIEGASAVVAEQRGAWTTVLLADDEGFSALCVTDDSAGLFSDAWIGSIGVADVGDPLPGGVVATDLGTGTVGSGDISLAAGKAGADVVGVSYRSAEHGMVSATVSQGHFAFWLPGDELASAGAEGVEVEVSLVDGRTASARLSL